MSEGISIGNEIKDGYEPTKTWVQSNIKWLSSLESFYRERAKLEKEYSDNLKQLTKEYFTKRSSETVSLSVGNSPTTTPGSLQSASQVAWNEILSQTELMANDHAQFAKDLSSGVSDQLKELGTRCESLLGRVDSFNLDLVKQKEACQNNLEKAKKRYYDSCQAMEVIRAKSSRSISEKAQRKLSDKEHDMNIAKNNYLIAINQANRMKDKFYFQDVPESLDMLQDLNEARTGMLNIIWQKAGTIEKEFHKRVDSRLETADSVILQNKTDLDITMFVKHNVKAWKEPSDFLYVPSSVWHDDEHFVVSSDVELQDLKERLAKAVEQFDQLVNQTESEKESLGNLSQERQRIKNENMTEPLKMHASLQKYVSVVTSFVDHENRKLQAEVEIESIQNNVGAEHDLNIDDIDLSQSNKKGGFLNKFKRTLTINSGGPKVGNGSSDVTSILSNDTHKSKKSTKFSIFKRSGRSAGNESTPFKDSASFGTINTEDSDTTSNAAREDNQNFGSSEQFASVLYDYSKTDADEVSVAGGSTVTVLNHDDGSGWTMVSTAAGSKGLVPSSYLEIKRGMKTNSTAPTAPPPRKTSTKTMKAMYEYQARGDDEITIHPGDVIKVINSDDGNGWTYGEINGNRGLFPTSYCK